MYISIFLVLFSLIILKNSNGSIHPSENYNPYSLSPNPEYKK